MSNHLHDLQVNGYGGVDFNQDDLTPEELHRACVTLEADGVASILATVITEHADIMAKRLARLVELRQGDELASRMIVGFHIEGPFLNEQEGYRGAHPVDAIRPADAEVMRRLLDAADGLTKLVTLAPERDANLAVTRMLVRQGVRVSAGHCDPTLEELDAALDAGLSMFTHLGNGCRAELPRHDNIVQRAISRADRMWLCFIADGAHVPFFALRNYIRAAGVERCLIVSDAIAPAGLGPGRYTLSRWELEIGEDLVARAPGGRHLVGSALGMSRAYQNLIDRVGLSEPEARQMAETTPAALLEGRS